MYESFVPINGVPTHIRTWGKWIEETPERKLIILIPGNPGVPEFYTKFLETIYMQLGENTPVWTLGHAGHEKPPENSLREVPALEGNEQLYNLNGQTEHKAAFIKKYVKENTKIYLIGHSIGSYIILQLLKDPEIKARVAAAYLLFPTIEHMASTPNGIFLTKVVRHFIWLLVLLTWVFTCLPQFIRSVLLYIYCFLHSMPRNNIPAVETMLKPNNLRCVFYMALDEMEKVKDPDYDIINENKGILKFYYGSKDGWAPVSYFQKLKNTIPNITAELCKLNYYHSFVLNSSKEVGIMVSQWIEADHLK